MKKKYVRYQKTFKDVVKNRTFKFFILLFVFLFTFILRAHNYERTPSPNHLDEQLYAWSGLYLVETGTPVSWSTLDYPKSAEVFKGVISYNGGDPKASVTLYKPNLDQPPLFSLLVGEAAHLFKADRTQYVPSSFIRFPIVLISAVTSLIVFAIAFATGGFWIGILAMLIYGTVPIFVLGSRVAMPENLNAMLYSLSVLLLILFSKKSKFIYVFPIPILAGIAGLSKVTGYFILPFAVFVVLKKLYEEKKISKAIKYIIYMILGTAPFVAAYFWYGFHFDKEIFLRILQIQSSRPAAFGSLAWFIISPSIGTTILKDSWYVFCLISALFFIFYPKDGLKRLVSLSFVYWVIVVMISAGEGDLLAWYRFPTFPILAILGAWGIQYIFERADFFASFIVSGLLLGSRTLLANAFRPNITPGAYRLTFSGLMSPSLANMIFNKNWLKKVSQLVIIGVIIVGMWWNVKYIYNAFELECESKTCPIVPSTILSTLHYPVIWRFFVLGDSTLH